MAGEAGCVLFIYFLQWMMLVILLRVLQFTEKYDLEVEKPLLCPAYIYHHE